MTRDFTDRVSACLACGSDPSIVVPPDEELMAQRDRALDAISSFLRHHSRLEHDYANTEQQRSLRELKAVLVEAGRKAP